VIWYVDLLGEDGYRGHTVTDVVSGETMCGVTLTSLTITNGTTKGWRTDPCPACVSALGRMSALVDLHQSAERLARTVVRRLTRARPRGRR